MEWCCPNQAGEHRSSIVNTHRLDGNDFGTRPDRETTRIKDDARVQSVNRR